MHDLKAMALFVEVVRYGSLSEAGRQLGISPSAVSRHINGLEESLGAKLLNRTSRQLSLTEAGTLYLHRAGQIILDVKELAESIGQLQSSPRGTLSIHARPSLAVRHIGPLLPELAASHPDLRFRLLLSDNDIDPVAHNIDVSVRIGQLPNSTLKVRKLAESKRYICASPSYLARRPQPENPDDLSDHNCLTYLIDLGPAIWRFRRGGDETAVAVRGNLETNNAELLRASVLAGMGIAHMPAWTINEDIASGALVRLLDSWQTTITTFDLGIYAVYQQTREVSARVRLFLNCLAANFQGHKDWIA